MFLFRFLQGPEIPEHQLYKEPPAAFLEADPLEVYVHVAYLLQSNSLFTGSITVYHYDCVQMCIWYLLSDNDL